MVERYILKVRKVLSSLGKMFSQCGDAYGEYANSLNKEEDSSSLFREYQKMVSNLEDFCEHVGLENEEFFKSIKDSKLH